MLIPAGYTVRFPVEGGPAGEHGSIVMKDKDWKLFLEKANPKGDAQIRAVARAWCRFGPADLPEKKFRFERRYENGGRNVRIDALKGHQVRFYGTTATDLDGKPMFIVTGTDFSKKQQSADQEFLNAAGKAALELLKPLRDRQKR